MKKIILLVFAISLLGCKKELSKKEILKNNIEQHFLKSAHDPNSYEFVSINIDTVYKKDFYKNQIDYYKYVYKINDFPTKIATYKELARTFIDKEKAKECQILLEKTKKEVTENKKNTDEFEKLFNNSIKDTIYEYSVIYKCRANNKLGAKNLNIYKVLLTDSLTIKSFKETK